MAFSLPSPPLKLPTSYASSTVNNHTLSASATSIRNTRKGLSLRRTFVVKASEKDDENPSFNPFGFVTDNPSSRSAIQLPENPAEDGNVGQMLYVSVSNYLRLFPHMFFQLFGNQTSILTILGLIELLFSCCC